MNLMMMCSSEDNVELTGKSLFVEHETNYPRGG